MGTHKRPKPNSLEGKRLKRVTQRRAYFAQAGVTIESVRRFDALLEKAGVRVAPEDWEVAIDWALQTYPIDTSRPVALAAIATSYAATLNSANHAASTSSRNLATALSGDPLHAWWMVFGISDEHGTLLGEAPLDVIDETCRTVADHPAWGVLGAARSVYLVASRQVTQVVDERVLRDIVGDDDAARDVLGGKVSRFAVSLAKDLGIPWKEGGGADLPRIKADIEAQYGALVEEAIGAGAWPWDEVLAKHLEITGPTGADYAAKIRAASQENMARALAGDSKVGNHAGPGAMLRFWNDPSQQKPLGLRWLSQVAKSLWHDEVKPELDRAIEAERALEADRSKRPAGVVRGTMANRIIPAMLTRQRHFEEFDEGAIKDLDGAVLGRIALTTDLTADMVRVKLEAFGTVAGQQALKAMIHRSHEEWLRGGEDARVVEFQGGWQGMCEAIGVRADGANVQILQDLAVAGQVVQWSTPHVDAGGFWTWGAKRGSKAAPGHIRFTLGDAMYPGRAAELAEQARKGQLTNGNSIGARKARRIVPELRFNPPTDAVRGNEKGPALIFHRLLLVEMVDEAVQMHTQGGILLTDARRDELGTRAGLPRSVVGRVWDSWQSDESEQSPALIKPAGDRWTLADAHTPEREFIESGGRVRGEKRKAGKAGARKRWGKP